MALLEIFKSKPKWLHSDPAVRAEAVRALSSEDQALLASIARTDADARVRRLAVKRLHDVAVLAEIVAAETDGGVREETQVALLALAMGEGEAGALLSALAALVDSKHLVAAAKGARVEAVRSAALERIGDPRSLAAVAREAADATQRLAALSRLSDTALRANVAQSSEHKDVALAALDSITERGTLKAIAVRAKVKAVARRAKALLDARAAETEPLPPAERHARLAQVCRTLEGLVHSKDWDHVAEELAASEAAWSELAPCSGDEALTERYEAARRAVHAGLARLEQERLERERQAAARGQAEAARLALCEEAAAAEGGPAQIDELRARWARLAPWDDPEAATLARRFEDACEAQRVRAATGALAAEREARRDALVSEAEALAAGEDLAAARARWAALEREWSAVSAGLADDRAARFDAARARITERQAAERAARAEKEKANLDKLSALAKKLEALAQAETLSFRDASRYLREATGALAEPGPLPTRRDRESLLGRLETARKKLYPRVQALREDEGWKRFANLSVQEELCSELEGLAELTDLDELARKVKEVDARWKTAQEAPRDQAEALHERFRKTRAAIAERLGAHFARQAAERAENLKRKEALCAQAEAQAEATDWAKTAESIRKLQAEWKAIGPVPRESAEALWQRFRGASDRFFGRFKEHRQKRASEWVENLKRKEALIASAEALAGSEDWEKGAAEIRGLSDEWKKIGPVRHSQAESVWQRFRQACDAFHERYKRRDAIAAAAALAEREELCRRVEGLLPPEGAEPQPPPTNLAEQVIASQAAWRKTQPFDDETSRPLATRFEQACLRLVELHPQSFAGTELDPEAARKKMEKLCVRVEAIVAECAPQAAGGSTADLAARLRSALAANAMGGQAERESRWHALKEDVEAARNAWRRLGSLPGGVDQPFADRFRAACDRFMALRPRGGRDDRRRPDAR
jgi:hypothetical protein